MPLEGREIVCCCEGLLSPHCAAKVHIGAPCETCGSDEVHLVHRGWTCAACNGRWCECGKPAGAGPDNLCAECQQIEKGAEADREARLLGESIY